jgi:hypothetical protein
VITAHALISSRITFAVLNSVLLQASEGPTVVSQVQRLSFISQGAAYELTYNLILFALSTDIPITMGREASEQHLQNKQSFCSLTI